MSKQSDKTFAEFVLKGVSYDRSTDFFILNPTFLEIILGAAEDKRSIQDLAKEKGLE